MFPAVWLWLDTGVLAKEVVLLGCGQRSVGIGAADHAELVGIYAELFTEHQAVLEGFASVFPLEHLGFLGLGAVEIGFVPYFIAGELVVGGKHGVCFAIALYPRDLYEPLKACAQCGEFLGERLSSKYLDCEHTAVAEITIMGNGQHFGASLLLELGELLPEVLGILAVVLGIRNGAVGHACIAAEDHIAVEIETANGNPLEADKGREAFRLIVFIGERCVGSPGIANRFLALDWRRVTGIIGRSKSLNHCGRISRGAGCACAVRYCACAVWTDPVEVIADAAASVVPPSRTLRRLRSVLPSWSFFMAIVLLQCTHGLNHQR